MGEMVVQMLVTYGVHTLLCECLLDSSSVPTSLAVDISCRYSSRRDERID